MRGRHHLQISLLTGLILLAPFLLAEPVLSAALLSGIGIGSLLPDCDASERSAKYGKPIVRLFDLISALAIYPLLRILFSGKKRHRGIMHTLIGVGACSAVLTAIACLIFAAAWQWPGTGILALFGAGLFSGASLHLLEDACTISGVNPFYPRCRGRVFRGNVSTTRKLEIRPAIFTTVLAILFSLLMALDLWYHLAMPLLVAVAIFSAFIAWTGFLLLCRIQKAAKKEYGGPV
jgi:membrane-bound metal-dependent hydrolase YbcI (DUF457 family)